MSSTAQPLHIWIFNDASVASLLRADSPLWPDTIPGLLVELSTRPVLAHALDLETPPAYPGLVGLLGPTTAPADLVIRLPDLPFPAILSPAQPAAAASAIAAVRRLRTESRIFGPRILLLDASLVPDILPALAAADRVGIAWDLSTPPGPQLQSLLSALAGENLLRPATWAGLLGYLSPDHQATEEERAAAATSLAALPSARLLPALAA